MPLQWRNQIWQSLEEGAGKRCSECGVQPVAIVMQKKAQGWGVSLSVGLQTQPLRSESDGAMAVSGQSDACGPIPSFGCL